MQGIADKAVGHYCPKVGRRLNPAVRLSTVQTVEQWIDTELH